MTSHKDDGRPTEERVVLAVLVALGLLGSCASYWGFGPSVFFAGPVAMNSALVAMAWHGYRSGVIGGGRYDRNKDERAFRRGMRSMVKVSILMQLTFAVAALMARASAAT